MLSCLKPSLKAQGALVGGVILLILLVAVVMPIFFQYFNSLSTMTMSTQVALEIRARGLNEKLDVFIPPEQDPWVSKGLYPSIILNNTGLIEVKIERIYIINATSGSPFYDPLLCGNVKPCGIIDVANATANPLVAGATPTVYNCLVGILRGEELVECLDDKPGRIPVLKPGETLFVKLVGDLTPYLPNIYVYVETSRGMIHPIAYAAKLGGVIGKGGLIGGKIPILPRGLYMPVTGFILWGYDELINYTHIEVIRPPYRISTLGPSNIDTYGYDVRRNIVYRCGGIPLWEVSSLERDPDHPGLFRVWFRPHRICWWEPCYIWVYTVDGWEPIRLWPDHRYYVEGFVGLFHVGKPSPDLFDNAGNYGDVCPEDLKDWEMIVIDGWAYDLKDSSGRSLITAPPASLPNPSPVIRKYDYDKNGISEVLTATSTWLMLPDGYEFDADGSNDIYGVSGEYDDVLAFKVVILRDITGVDAIGVYIKAEYDWLHVLTDWSGDPWIMQQQPALAIGLLRLDRETLQWRLAAFKVERASQLAPKTYWVSELFPVNRTDIYRVVIFIYDSYSWISNDGRGVVGWCTNVTSDGVCYGYRPYSFDSLDFIISLEHVIVNYYVYNPLLKKVPVVYIVNITGVSDWPGLYSTTYGTFGQLNITLREWFWRYFVDTLKRNGIQPITITSWDEFRVLLGSADAPVNPIVIFAHGPVLPYPNGVYLYDPSSGGNVYVDDPYVFTSWLAKMIQYRGWVVVFPFGPPLAFAQAPGYSLEDYSNGDLLSSFFASLTSNSVTDVSYIYVATGGFVYHYGQYSLANYTAGLTSEGLDARRALRAWRMPRVVYANYSLVSSSSSFYSIFHPYYFNTTPPPGFDYWWQLNVAGNYASPAGYVMAGRGAVVFIAVSRPGVLDPVKLAEIVLALSLYTWKLVVGA